MRTLVDIPEADVKALDKLGERRGASRSKIIRQAIREYLIHNLSEEGEQAFGLWRGRNVDGLDYQRRARSEW
ncbi:MAG TPA: ribbon-helix-helix protein, CopG family [Caulobacteraceae bacterium]|jgi:metal-responsive CopG/Arc/MetJ family transcriptional regulator|nr:ribbon-helix-helix protein, CopG family [Caulobacteraceae bacterium]